MIQALVSSWPAKSIHCTIDHHQAKNTRYEQTIQQANTVNIFVLRNYKIKWTVILKKKVHPQF